MANKKEKKVNIDSLIDKSLDRIQKIEKLHSDTYHSAKAKGIPSLDSSDNEVKDYLSNTVAQYDADVKAGGVGKGKVTEEDKLRALGKMLTLAERHGMTIDNFLHQIKTGNYQVMDYYHRSEKDRHVDEIKTGFYGENIHPIAHELHGDVADKLGTDKERVMREFKPHFNILHEKKLHDLYLKPKKYKKAA